MITSSRRDTILDNIRNDAFSREDSFDVDDDDRMSIETHYPHYEEYGQGVPWEEVEKAVNRKDLRLEGYVQNIVDVLGLTSWYSYSNIFGFEIPHEITQNINAKENTLKYIINQIEDEYHESLMGKDLGGLLKL